jgi:hypothetical protein
MSLTFVNLVTPKARAEHEHLFKKSSPSFKVVTLSVIISIVGVFIVMAPQVMDQYKLHQIERPGWKIFDFFFFSKKDFFSTKFNLKLEFQKHFFVE